MTQRQAVWINAVFVNLKNRKQGISAQLINHAEKTLKKCLNQNYWFLLIYRYCIQI